MRWCCSCMAALSARTAQPRQQHTSQQNSALSLDPPIAVLNAYQLCVCGHPSTALRMHCEVIWLRTNRNVLGDSCNTSSLIETHV